VAKTNHLVMGKTGKVLYLMLVIQVFQTTVQKATKPMIWFVLLPQRVRIKCTSWEHFRCSCLKLTV